MVRGEKKNWKMLVIKYLMPLKKWESIDVIDGSIGTMSRKSTS